MDMDINTGMEEELNLDVDIPQEYYTEPEKLEQTPMFFNNSVQSLDISKYFTIFFIVFLICLLFLQKRIIILIFKEFINLDKKTNVYFLQSLCIALSTSYSMQYI